MEHPLSEWKHNLLESRYARSLIINNLIVQRVGEDDVVPSFASVWPGEVRREESLGHYHDTEGGAVSNIPDSVFPFDSACVDDM